MQCDTIMTQWKYFMKCSVCSVLVYLSQKNALGFGRVLSALPNCLYFPGMPSSSAWQLPSLTEERTQHCFSPSQQELFLMVALNAGRKSTESDNCNYEKSSRVRNLVQFPSMLQLRLKLSQNFLLRQANNNFLLTKFDLWEISKMQRNCLLQYNQQ